MTEPTETASSASFEAEAGRTLFLDPIHSSVSFSLTAMGVSVFRAGFEKMQGTLQIERHRAILTASVEVDSISIREPAAFRAHMLGDDFFAADQHPLVTFESDPFDVSGEEAAIAGRLTVRGTTCPVAGTARWAREMAEPSGKERWHLTLGGVLDRREFGITWNSQLPSGDNQLGHEVCVEAELGFVTAP